MSDEIDSAQIESDFLLSLRLSKRAQYQGESAEYCTGCGEAVPAARRKALPGVRLCVFCAERRERTGTR